MDAEGAQVLRRKIEQHQHWRLAAGVRDGRQPGRDPDAADLVDCAGTVRLYQPVGATAYEKVLVDELWVAQRVSEATRLASAGFRRDDASPNAA